MCFLGIPRPAYCDHAQNQTDRWCTLNGLEAVGICFVYFANGLATSRAALMKSCAIGLSVRPFRVTIPIGTGDVGRSTGKILISEPLAKTLASEKIDRKRPVARSLIRTSGIATTVACGKSSPLARKISDANIEATLSGGGITHNSLASSASLILRRRDHGLCTPAATT